MLSIGSLVSGVCELSEPCVASGEGFAPCRTMKPTDGWLASLDTSARSSRRERWQIRRGPRGPGQL
ncbi:hypothetical protein RRG08_044323, partial [Elysia crispata]